MKIKNIKRKTVGVDATSFTNSTGKKADFAFYTDT